MDRPLALDVDRQERRITTSAAGPGAAPVDIAIDQERAVALTWPDGHLTHLPLPLLRERCPCAACERSRRAGGAVWSGDADRLEIAGAELVGGWGLGLAWSDGHATGVYSWDMLRSWCGCATCSSRP